MNNEQRENFEDLKEAERMAQVLETGQCETMDEARAFELGRMLRESAEHDLPESSDSLREKLLMELADGDAPVAPTKTVTQKEEYKVSRKRMWLSLATGVLLLVGGWLGYSSWAVSTAQRNWISEVDDLKQIAESSINYESANQEEVVEFVTSPKVDAALPSPNVGPDFQQNSLGMDALASVPTDEWRENKKFVAAKQGKQQKEQAASTTNLFVLPEIGYEPQSGRINESLYGYKNSVGKGDTTSSKWHTPTNRSGQPNTGGVKLNGVIASENRMTWGLRGGAVAPGQQDATRFVDVPDGGTVLIGGIKEESLEQNEFKLKLLPDDTLPMEDFSRREQYTPIHENLFVQATGGSAISTFSIDVDTASYANMRRFLSSGQRPPRNSVRIEELVNYFDYDYPQPEGDDPFSVNMELATCPWNEARKLLRVGLKGKEVHVNERPATNVVYLIDVSGSMNSQDKLPLLKSGFQMMTKQLGENDRVSIVTYAGNAGVALEPTIGDKTKTINEAIERLTPGGSTHGSAGIELAYKLAQQNFINGGVNKVILATDGDLNVGVTDDDSLVKLIKQKASEGVFLTVLGFGTGNLKDGKLEKIADNGNGHYAYIDSNREAHRVLVQQMSGSLVTIAKDVKIQIEFNPAEVKSYRLIGYENRMLATKDFDDDRKDAGEIGAGHTVTAIYEIEPTGGVASAFAAPAGMKYQTAGVVADKQEEKVAGLTEAAASGELATLALRYKKPDENKSKRIEFAIKNEDRSFVAASEDFRFAASVAGFGMLLRGSEHSGSATFQSVMEIASESIGDDPSGYRAEFVDLIRKACYGQ